MGCRVLTYAGSTITFTSDFNITRAPKALRRHRTNSARPATRESNEKAISDGPTVSVQRTATTTTIISTSLESVRISSIAAPSALPRRESTYKSLSIVLAVIPNTPASTTARPESVSTTPPLAPRLPSSGLSTTSDVPMPWCAAKFPLTDLFFVRTAPQLPSTTVSSPTSAVHPPLPVHFREAHRFPNSRQL